MKNLVFIIIGVSAIILVFSIFNKNIENEDKKNKILNNEEQQEKANIDIFSKKIESSVEDIDKNFKKYTNKNFGLSFIFPSSFQIEEYLQINDYFIIINKKTIFEKTNSLDKEIFNSLKIKISDINNFENIINNYKKEFKKNDFYRNGTIKYVGEKTIIEYTDPYSGEIILITLLKTNNNLITISYFKDSKNVIYYKDIIDSIAL